MTIDSVIQAGALGIVAWVIFYVFSKLIPKMMDSFTSSLTAQTDSFKQALTEQRQEFKEINENLRVVHIDALKGISERAGARNDKLTDQIADLIIEMRKDGASKGVKRK